MNASEAWLSKVEADVPSPEQKKLAEVIAQHPDDEVGFGGGGGEYADEVIARLAGIELKAVGPALRWLEDRGHIDITVHQASTTGSILILNRSATLVRNEQRLQEIGFGQVLGDWYASNCQVRISPVDGEWEIAIHLPDPSREGQTQGRYDSWISARTSKLHGRTRAEIALAAEQLCLEQEERRREAEAEPRITPAGTVINFNDGTWAVMLNDFMADMGELASVQCFENKERAEAFAAEVREAREKVEGPPQ